MANEQITELINDVAKAESMMIDIYEKIMKKCNSEKVIKVLKKIDNDEKRHLKNANKILEILNS